MKQPVSLSVSNLSWSLPHNNQEILKSVSFDLEKCKILGVVGPNGAGKSTLLRLLYRYLKPTTGNIKIDGKNIWSMSANKVACEVAVVLQEQPTDFSLTVKEIVTLGRTPYKRWFGRMKGEDHETIVKSSMKKLNLLELADRELDTLSGGERQRVMLARALAQEPGLIILDEPTNHLDIRQQLELLTLIKALPLTIVTSLHDLNMAASNCDDILLLKDGFPLGFGKPEKILSAKKITDTFEVNAKKEVLIPSNNKQITFHL